jgi:mannose-1-phosphate guanylyltransferase/phosphomannomutase
VEIAPDAQLYGPVFLGEAAKIKGGVIVRGPSVIRDFTIVDNRSHVDRSIVWRNCYIGERCELRGAIVGRQCSMKSKVMVFEGAVIGDNVTVGDGAIIQPNVKIWPDKEIETGATVSSSVIWGAQGRRVLFGRWGVTGLVNVDITPEFGAKLGAAYGATLPKGATVVMNRDPHRTPRMIKRAMISGLPSAGVNVLDIKSVPIPVARYITRHYNANGGVHVRLSPYDNRVVDIKIFDSQGLDIQKTVERKIENTFFREDFRRVYLNEIGSITEAGQLAEKYTEGFLNAIDVAAIQRASNVSLVIDYGNSTASLVLPQIVNQFGWNVVALNASVDENRLSRTMEQFDESMRQLALITMSLRAGLGVRLDTGGEKIFVGDDRGQILPGWTLFAALASLVLRAHPGGKLAVPVTAPRLVERLAADFGGSVVYTRFTPEALMAAAASDDSLVLVGDGEGSFIFPQFQPAIDGLFAAAKIIELLASQGANLVDVVRSLPPYHIARSKVPCPWEEKGKVMRLLAEQYHDTTVQQIDGVKIGLGEEWVLVLPDIDRPLFHILAESNSNDGARILVEKYAALVSSLQR